MPSYLTDPVKQQSPLWEVSNLHGLLLVALRQASEFVEPCSSSDCTNKGHPYCTYGLVRKALTPFEDKRDANTIRLVELTVTNIMQRLDNEHLFNNEELQCIREAVASEIIPVSNQIDYLHLVLDLCADPATKDAVALFEEKVPKEEDSKDGG